jgi:hypothetical protein
MRRGEGPTHADLNLCLLINRCALANAATMHRCSSGSRLGDALS